MSEAIRDAKSVLMREAIMSEAIRDAKSEALREALKGALRNNIQRQLRAGPLRAIGES